MDVITKKDLMEQYKLRPNFIKVHGREMGGFNKPMIWIREKVEQYLIQCAEESMSDLPVPVALLDITPCREKVIPIGRRIQGRGGRAKRA